MDTQAWVHAHPLQWHVGPQPAATHPLVVERFPPAYAGIWVFLGVMKSRMPHTETPRMRGRGDPSGRSRPCATPACWHSACRKSLGWRPKSFARPRPTCPPQCPARGTLNWPGQRAPKLREGRHAQRPLRQPTQAVRIQDGLDFLHQGRVTLPEPSRQHVQKEVPRRNSTL